MSDLDAVGLTGRFVGMGLVPFGTGTRGWPRYAFTLLRFLLSAASCAWDMVGALQPQITFPSTSHSLLTLPR